jgi:hypothetical protein
VKISLKNHCAKNKFAKFPLDKKTKKCKIIILAENVGKHSVEETMKTNYCIRSPLPIKEMIVWD